jgi:predicted hydrocarbon binding protein/KaiC/GvpD/RAD55 family RecA-like ATPase
LVKLNKLVFLYLVVGLRLVSVSQLQEVPSKNLMLLVGPPGSGKTTFCQQTTLSNIELRPIIYVTTESGPSVIEESLRAKGLGKELLHQLGFVDAFHETMGLPSVVRSDTVVASSEDLTSLSIAISKLQETMGETVLLIFDSLTSPYLLSGVEILRFMRMTLLRLAAQGNAVLACIDEGCGKLEDLVAMMSISNGVIKMETSEGKHLLNVVKHPKLKPTRIEAPIEPEPIGLEERIFNPEVLAAYIRGDEAVMRKEVGDFVNLFWPNFAHWSGMLWDPKRFPMMVYEMNKEDGPSTFKLMKENEALKRAMFPWPKSLLLRFMPKSFSKVKDMKKLVKGMERSLGGPEQERSGIVEYLEDRSKPDEHYFRLYESSECWGFKDVGAMMGFYSLPCLAGMIKGFESWRGLERDWNCVETKCIGLGDPYCEGKAVPGEIDELQDSLEKDVSVIEKIHERLMHHLMGFLLHGTPLLERPTLGSMVNVHRVVHAMVFPALAGERYRMVLGMGGAKAGKQVGERLLEAGLREDEAVKRVLNFLNQCKVGKVTVDETIRIVENCESSQTKIFTTKEKVPSCYFTTGFLNGFFSAVKNQHVKETKCIAMEDPYCEWEFR